MGKNGVENGINSAVLAGFFSSRAVFVAEEDGQRVSGFFDQRHSKGEINGEKREWETYEVNLLTEVTHFTVEEIQLMAEEDRPIPVPRIIVGWDPEVVVSLVQNPLREVVLERARAISAKREG